MMSSIKSVLLQRLPILSAKAWLALKPIRKNKHKRIRRNHFKRIFSTHVLLPRTARGNLRSKRSVFYSQKNPPDDRLASSWLWDSRVTWNKTSSVRKQPPQPFPVRLSLRTLTAHTTVGAVQRVITLYIITKSMRAL